MTIRAGFSSALTIAIFWTLLAVPLAMPLVAQTSPPAGNGAGQSVPNTTVSNPAPLQPQPLPLAPPFVLSPAEEGNLNQLLVDWEKANSSIKTFKCSFTRLEYDPAIAGGNPNQQTTESYGEVKYAAPDKGMFKVEEMYNYVLNPSTTKFEKQKADPTEWWTCDGKSMFEVTVRNNGDKVEKLVVETPLPPEMRGQAITDGPLPFVFGAKAKTLKDRYFMRVITPPANAQKEVWLEAFPKLQKDAANFSRVMIILDKASFQPLALQIFNPGANAQNNSRTVIKLEDASINSPLNALQNFFNNFAQPNPIGFKRVLNQNVVPPPAAAQLPAGNPADNSQANRTKSTAR